MRRKNYFLVSGVIFFTIFIVHGLRIISGWEGVIAGWNVPMSVSWIAVVIAAFLAATAITLYSREQ